MKSLVSRILSIVACSLGLSGCIERYAPVPDASVAIDAPASDTGIVRLPCATTFGSSFPSSFVRIDGRLVAVVPPTGAHACRSDSDHLHLQVLVRGATYDIAVTARSTTDPTMPDVFLDRVTLAPPGEPFAEGAHTGASLDYVSLGVRSSDFTAYPESQLVTMLEGELADVDEITIYATGYPGGDGAHLVHRNAPGQDGALVLHPLDATSAVLLFHFSTQSF